MQLEGTDSFYPHDAMLMPDAGTGCDPVSLSVCLIEVGVLSQEMNRLLFCMEAHCRKPPTLVALRQRLSGVQIS